MSGALSLRAKREADNKILDGEQSAEQGNVRLRAHLESLHDSSCGLPMVPVMGGWNNSTNRKEPAQTLLKYIERLHVIVNMIASDIQVIEVNV